MAYLILVFLLWFVVCPDKKMRLRRISVWWVLLAVIVYGAGDELLQRWVGRSCDIGDFGANLAGIVTGVILLSLFSFWPAVLMVAAGTIFGLTNVARANLADLLPIPNAIFNLCSYVVFTALWVRYIRHFLSPKPPSGKWLMAALGLPAALLLAVRLFSLVLSRSFTAQDVILSLAGIALVVGAVGLKGLLHAKPTQAQESASGG
jgi:hypothetical protein